MPTSAKKTRARSGAVVLSANFVKMKSPYPSAGTGPKFTRAGLDCEGRLNQHSVVETWLGASFWGEIVMTVEGLVIWLVIGAIAGWLAGLIMKGYGFGLVGNIVVGIVGAFIAGWLLPRIGFVFIGGIGAEIINAVIGAVILLAVIGLVKRAT
jgi:uncharacterized membrane protein YeaQ/YmgE (transglycosylase-associated protein family)